MKNAGTPQRAAAADQGPAAHQVAPGQHADGRTRHAVARLLLERGPITAAAVADELGVSPTAVRRHLDVLLAEGEAYTRDASARGRRGRGRPAKLFLLTEVGRARFGHAYDDLAVAALRFIAETDGEQAVRAFAERRMAALVANHHEALAASGSPAERAEVLANALTREGYAASTRRVGSGEQLCQHHCPVAHVAADFPQLCEAETAAFAEVLGTHVQRLATIANGDAVCTTHVPLARSERGESSARTDPKTAGPVPKDRQETAPIPDGGEPV
ncbi:transcriptional regulator [Saccharopolyspora erythraea NRRL 2338]|uniref:Transcriptional regulator n=2 Tax=Saccharopolyspora erythraea TaxID=1836 RepID=A0ABP3MJJ9_SACER|nr:metalloregulator ArsR/SmtB family transcription factor [Saccharopolyspora erythraea]EQD87519.1 ArsR family transcriptional regulator [Saccharopolyspora erythraea D]PFG95257.1 transcriptional regulator [Saccharopolyspora erythraea NRRL 2338]QRK91909.1 transcriptional regulator [Saccharopolyspora erythraea]CAM01479.1 probable transcriptional regulator [Saccharopolyspora erythraea NRRL 2338]